MTSLINWKAWSPNIMDLCLEMFPHLMMLQDHSFFFIVMTFGQVRMLTQDVPSQMAGLVTHTCDKFQNGIREVFLSFPGGF